jgi:hypothetical protein
MAIITREELDRAEQQGRLRFGKVNQRPVHCACCVKKLVQGDARYAYIDEFPRGYLCCRCGGWNDDSDAR